jgi:putative Mg2+ transporter-C (MgtC) family protein
MYASDHISVFFQDATASVIGKSAVRLILAAALGGLVGLERQLKHRPAGLRTNMFICFGAAMFTVLSEQLASPGGGDKTRISAQVITGIGFIGAGTIMHDRSDMVRGLTTAATLFVVASIGMAAGGGLYFVAILATAIILLSLLLFGGLERQFNLKLLLHVYEVQGSSFENMKAEVNAILESCHILMRNVHKAETPVHVRMQFEIEGTRRTQDRVLRGLQSSKLFESVTPLGPVEVE